MRLEIRVKNSCSVKKTERVIQIKRDILGFNFINVLWAAFTHADPESIKKTDNLTIYFTLSESACTKPAHRTLMKLTLGVGRRLAKVKLESTSPTA